MTQSMQWSTLYSCWDPVPSFLRPGLKFLDHLPKMWDISSCLFINTVFDHLIWSCNVCMCVLGGQAAERTADGNEGTQRDLHGSWTQQVSRKHTCSVRSACKYLIIRTFINLTLFLSVIQVHPHSRCIWWTMYRRPFGNGWLPGCHRLWNRNPIGCYHHLSVLWDIC